MDCSISFLESCFVLEEGRHQQLETENQGRISRRKVDLERMMLKKWLDQNLDYQRKCQQSEEN